MIRELCSRCIANGRHCTVPESCGVPLPRQRTYRPDFTVRGPFRSRTSGRAGRIVMLGFGLPGLFFIAGALGRHFGIF